MEAAAELTKDGIKTEPEIMIPVVCTVKELTDQLAVCKKIYEETLKSQTEVLWFGSIKDIFEEFMESIMRFIELIIDKYTELDKSKSSAKNMMRIFGKQIKKYNSDYYNTDLTIRRY